MKLAFRVKSDADPELLQEILDASGSHSPVFDSVTKPLGVEATVAKA